MAHLDFNDFKIASWNIQAAKDKLNEKDVKHMLQSFSFVILSEIKTSAKISCTGFTVYQHSAKQGHRGGVALLMKPGICKYLRKLDKSYENVLSFELAILPGILFVGCYIAPSDSPYYDSAIFGYLQSLMKRDGNKKILIMGDLNSRVGSPASLEIANEKCAYEGVEDITVNKNGQCMLELCEDNKLVILNNLKFGDQHFKSKLSFRKKKNWISEPDVIVVSESCVQHVESFNMLQRYNGKLLYSDHAMVELTLNLKDMGIPVDLLRRRANNLGRTIHECNPIRIERSLHLKQCNSEKLSQYFLEHPPPTINPNDNVDVLLDGLNRVVIDTMKANKEETLVEPSPWGNAERWKRLLLDNDHKKIWRSIGWNGDIVEENTDTPSDAEFRMHFEQLLNPPGGEGEDEPDTSNSPYIPLLDDPIEEVEVIEAAESSKESKSFVGITPAIFKCLSPLWILFITQILNMVFCSDNWTFPIKWCYNKLIVLFKKGARLNCGNYRGISIGDTIGKLYAKILGNRLKRWMNVDNCQAGGQEERGCMEHIPALRLIIDYAVKEKVKLFILFVDFSKAYDKVPRGTLFDLLRNLGCGKRFLRAIIAIYKNTINILNSEYVKATIGVKQGGPMSCLLFVIYLNVLALMLRALGNDSFLVDVHALMLMDDTVLLASTRDKIIEKFTVLMNFCVKYGMVVNELKTQMMVVNGSAADRYDFTVGNVVVKNTKSYIYLGSPFTENGKLNDVIKMHAKSKVKDLNKFKIFCKKNESMPYLFKKKVLEAAIVSSLLYGCESWLSSNLKDIEKMYIGAIKALLGVRETTRTDTTLIETGMPSLKQLVSKRTSTFMKKELSAERTLDTPLIKIFKICEAKRTGGFLFLSRAIDPTANNETSVIETFQNRTSSKATTYKTINPDLSLHTVYTSSDYINERERLVFTRFRLSSHHLKVETGRWARIEAANRVCDCGNGIQDESHVLFVCPKTESVREKFGVRDGVFRNIGELMNSMDIHVLIPFVYNCMKIFD